MLAAAEQDWSVQKIAAELNLSPSRLHALYKAAFDIAPRQDVILMRVEKAKALLWQNNSVTETAAQLGYASVYHFIRQFRQTTGVSAKQYVRSSGKYPARDSAFSRPSTMRLLSAALVRR